MDESAPHQMQLNVTYSTGVEEWYCPTCGRRLIMQWPPHYKKVILEQGDENETHTGGKGPVCLGTAQVSHVAESEAAEEIDCVAWEVWLTDVDLGDPPSQ